MKILKGLVIILIIGLSLSFIGCYDAYIERPPQVYYNNGGYGYYYDGVWYQSPYVYRDYINWGPYYSNNGYIGNNYRGYRESRGNFGGRGFHSGGRR